LLTLKEAQAALLARIIQVDSAQNVPLQAAHGRYVAQALRAAVDNPAFDNSAMDGYALDSADLRAGADLALPLNGESSCGNPPGVLQPGTTMRIFTGAPLPQGADTVVIQENIKQQEDRILFPANITPGAHIRRRGEDFHAGDALYQPGRRLTAFDLALLSSAGIAEVPVYRRARALVIATGDELVAPGTPLKPGQIYESNQLATQVLLQQLGTEAVNGGTVNDDPDTLRDLLNDAADYDFIVTSGGVSVGDYDLVKQVFAEIGEIHFWKARIKPGKPVAFGRIGPRTHFFALPGNPVSSLVTFKLFVEPALIHWHHGRYQRPELKATAAGGFKRRAGRMEFLRARLTVRDGDLVAATLAGQGSHMLAPLRETNGFIVLPEDSSGYGDGDTVTVMLLGVDFS